MSKKKTVPKHDSLSEARQQAHLPTKIIGRVPQYHNDTEPPNYRGRPASAKDAFKKTTWHGSPPTCQAQDHHEHTHRQPNAHPSSNTPRVWLSVPVQILKNKRRVSPARLACRFSSIIAILRNSTVSVMPYCLSSANQKCHAPIPLGYARERGMGCVVMRSACVNLAGKAFSGYRSQPC